MADSLSKLPWSVILLLCVTIGLAPYAPPHVLEKLRLLFAGGLTRPLDWFDFLLHGFPWALLAAKAALALKKPPAAPGI